MMTLSQLTELLGWASILNIAYLLLGTLVLSTLRESIMSLHSRMFGMAEADLPRAYFSFLANYKMLSLILTVFPYLALKIMGY